MCINRPFYLLNTNAPPHLARRPARGSGKFELRTVRGRLVRPGLDLDHTSALVAMDDEAAFGGKS
jgi:hypothetical protein